MSETKFSRKKKWVIGSAAVAIVGVVVAALFVFLKPEPAFRNSETYQQIESIATIDGVKPASIVITPEGEDWWGTLLNYTSNTDLDALDYKMFSEGVEYLSFSLSNPEGYQDIAAIGVPTTYVVYGTAKEAQQASEKIPGGTGFHVQDNIVVFVPSGAYIDVDYSVKAYKKQKSSVDASDADLNGKAVWEINVEEFNTLFSKIVSSDEDQKVYDETLTKLGMTDETRWVGTSVDGLKWEGEVSGFNGLQVKGTELMSFFSQQIRNIGSDGKIIWTPLNEVPEEEQTGIIAQRQSVLQDYMIVNDETGTLSGNITGADGMIVKASDVTKGAKGSTDIIVNPNPWLSFMAGKVISYPFSYFQEARIHIDGASVSIDLTPAAWEK